ncbi:hypothetical protein SH668x_001254 [Planctomicrobium sp. SH668]|uniref:hypothetical protein n=1 Tax=Planctomicrobium sp. SH668 TaxID=3448126 RepID=UPI003F5AF270
MSETSYSELPELELTRREARILARRYETRAEIDRAFYGDAYRAGQHETRIENWSKAYADSKQGEVLFGRRAFRSQLVGTFGSMSVLTILYYLAVALYYWWRLRGNR